MQEFTLGGTAIIFNNTFDSNFANPIIVSYYRSCYGGGHTICIPPLASRCNGTSPLDGNEDPSGYPCFDQIGRGPNQTSAPVYEWNNRKGVSATHIQIYDAWGCDNPSMSDHIKENRDFFNGIQAPGYTPLVYPHPLTQEGAMSPPTPPGNLTIK